MALEVLSVDVLAPRFLVAWSLQIGELPLASLNGFINISSVSLIFISFKVVEKAAQQLSSIAKKYPRVLSLFYSLFCNFHSTIVTLLKVQKDNELVTLSYF